MKFMKQLATVLLCVSVLLAPVVFTIGCQTSAPPTKEAITFYSFKDTWTAAHTAYQGYQERVVMGQVDKASAAEIDKQWNTFRALFKISLQSYKGDLSAPPPDSLLQAKDTLIIFIRASL